MPTYDPESNERIADDELDTHARAMIDKLQQQIAFLLTHPTIANSAFFPSRLYVYADSQQHFDVMRRELGSYDKGVDDYNLYADKALPGGAFVRVSVSRGSVCEKVKTGTRTVEREVYPDDVKPEIVTEEEDVYEWECPPSWGEKAEA